MAIVCAYTVPHPPLAIPGVGKGQEKGIEKTLASFEEASSEIAKLAPDTIVFITPHNILYADYFHISPGLSAHGDFSRFNDHSTRIDARYDVEMASEIIRLAEKNGIPAGSKGERDASLDHGVTVPMWFINRRFSDYKTVRISQSGMDPADHYCLGKLISEAAGITGRKTVIIASSDLSHKLIDSGPYGFAPEGPAFDAEITRILSTGDFLSLFNIPSTLRERAAECGYNSLMVMAGCFDCQSVTPRLLSYEGPYGVGYAIASFSPGPPDDERCFLDQYNEISLARAHSIQSAEDPYRALARRSLEHRVVNGTDLPFPDGLPAELLHNKAGVFVSLYKNDRLRGCIGTISPVTSDIAHEIAQNAVSAGLHDNRFDPVSVLELPYLTYKVDILSPPAPISSPNELDVKRYGVIVSSGRKRGLLLPNLDGVETVDQQISIAKQKAGISEKEPVKLERFEVRRHE